MHVYVSGCQFYRRSLYCHSVSFFFFLMFLLATANLKAGLLFAHQSSCGFPHCAKQMTQALFIIVHLYILDAD